MTLEDAIKRIEQLEKRVNQLENRGILYGPIGTPPSVPVKQPEYVVTDWPPAYVVTCGVK